MDTPINRQVKILGLSFLLIFFGFGAVQSYVTVFFAEAKMADIGFYSLILIYIFFSFFSSLAAVFVSKYGAKRCMILGSIFYFLFILTLLLKSVPLVYLASASLGIGAALLWTGQNSYLVRASNEESYGKNSGFFTSVCFLGSALGLIILSFLVARFSFRIPFLLYALFSLFGLFSLTFLKDLRREEKRNHSRSFKNYLTSVTMWRLFSIGFIFNFTLGLTAGIIPIEVKNNLGLLYVGILSSLMYIFPILLSYFFGRFSDIKGRERAIIFSYLLLFLGLLSLLFSRQPAFLIMGVVILALNWAVIRPMLFALIGDISVDSNLEHLAGLFWMVQNGGVVFALIISQIFKTEAWIIYLISIFITAISFLISFPLLRLGFKNVREKILQEL